MIEKTLQYLIDYIEMNLENDLTLDDCADITGYSKYHLHRLFINLTGISIGAYIRGRRLNLAYTDVRQGVRLIDIALKFGYQSERAFSRAFVQHYGISPSKCRHVGKLSVSPMVIADLIRKRDIVMEKYLSDVFFETLEDMNVIACTRFSNNPEEEVIGFLTEYTKKYNIQITGRNFGFDVPLEESLQDQGVRGYQYWLELEANQSDKIKPNLDEQVEYLQIKGAEYGVLRIEDPFMDPFERIPKGWQRMINWINSQDMVKQKYSNNGYCLEEVKTIEDSTVMDLYVPIGPLSV